MIRLENVDVYGWEAAIRGMRNPMNSWGKSDSAFVAGKCSIGPEDEKLMMKLANAGPDHGKFLRMIVVALDITAPLYWWKEFDTYKVGTVANSCSTMHKLDSRPLTIRDFSTEWLDNDAKDVLGGVIMTINGYREYYCATHDKCDWYQMIQLLPSSYNQRRTVMLNYQVLRNMHHARKQHKLDEWRDFCKWVETLPYAGLITEA